LALGTVAAVLVVAAPAGAATPTIPQPELGQIRTLLRAFIPAAIGRHHPGRAWALAAPKMRVGSTQADWRKGDLPVFPYPVSTTGFGMRPITVAPGEGTFDVVVHPEAGSNAGVEVFTTEVQKVGGKWRVASMAAEAAFAGSDTPATIMAQPDYAPHANGITTHRNLSAGWALVPLLAIGLPLIAAPFALLIVWRRGRSLTAAVEARDRATAPWR
jgi:hypothetical protein